MHKRTTLITVSLIISMALVLSCNLFFPIPTTPEDTMIRAKNYSNGKFFNSEPTAVFKSGRFWSSTYQFLFKGHPERSPRRPLPVVSMNGYAQEQVSQELRFAWLGHASVLVELGGKRILIDPVFSERASFFQWMGPKRFQPAPLQAGAFPALDAVLISHDHYDHLDEATIRGLAGKTASFHVPLRVAPILESWGIPKSKIVEYAWWEEHELNGLTIAAVPARHFSGRSLFNRFETLWCSWVVFNNKTRIYHTGDTGITSQFQEIGVKYGPFDVAFIKMSAYHENWPDIHLNPEEALVAFHDVRGNILVPIHWGVFDLSTHSWYEPIERLVKAAERAQARVITPRMGELVVPDNYENTYWWRPFIMPSPSAGKAL
jgi:L-ascorbate metabolism protein UlaG (beta-lactamase superfamily)